MCHHADNGARQAFSGKRPLPEWQALYVFALGLVGTPLISLAPPNHTHEIVDMRQGPRAQHCASDIAIHFLGIRDHPFYAGR